MHPLSRMEAIASKATDGAVVVVFMVDSVLIA
jgi:hypothetical protein